ncbi:hypothetical protein CH292_25825 [Rhodococcus sp. 14-2470-1a]|nr:hypothetical protein CH292_25825 [Rhodococcus sp. 14-2470-1a]
MLLRLQIFTPGTDVGTGPATVSVGCVGTCVVNPNVRAAVYPVGPTPTLPSTSTAICSDDG